jgi:hypothetical protein
MFPETIHFNKSHAEVEIFDALKQQLDERWTVLHHVRWLEKRQGGRARDGETDFLVAHPEYGALVLEVKGGAEV